jgi:hypothetical protein
VKANAERQLALLLAAFKCLKPGGRVVYATCALAERENDDVVRKALKKTRIAVRVDPAFAATDPSQRRAGVNADLTPPASSRGSAHPLISPTGVPFTKTEFGFHVLPDQVLCVLRIQRVSFVCFACVRVRACTLFACPRAVGDHSIGAS